jgi:hypothetical protein
VSLPGIDWSTPWLAPYRALGQPLHAAVLGGNAVAAALNEAVKALPQPPRLDHGPLCFVSQAALPAGEAYEAFIHRTASVPTRDNLHDFFNGLVWLHAAPLKAALNRLQAAQIAATGIGQVRGPTRDALTLFDENGALLRVPEVLLRALSERRWKDLFISDRRLWPGGGLLIVGHALLEQLAVAPRKGLTAHALAADPVHWTAGQWAAKPFLPLPVSGVPGWWAAQDEPGFYSDAAVFRPHRHRSPGPA